MVSLPNVQNNNVSILIHFLYLGGLSGVGLGLGPGGQPIDATQLNRGGGGMGNMGPGGSYLLNGYVET